MQSQLDILAPRHAYGQKQNGGGIHQTRPSEKFLSLWFKFVKTCCIHTVGNDVHRVGIEFHEIRQFPAAQFRDYYMQCLAPVCSQQIPGVSVMKFGDVTWRGPRKIMMP